jgi:hypothetical protein
MIRALLVFIIFWALVTFAITSWRSLSNKERWSTVKLFTYGFITATITSLILATIVILF